MITSELLTNRRGQAQIVILDKVLALLPAHEPLLDMLLSLEPLPSLASFEGCHTFMTHELILAPGTSNSHSRK
jgi:hypothetical protein